MGYGIQTLPTFLEKLERSPKDWCLVAIRDLLRARPEFAEKCGTWSAFSSLDWVRLLRARPELRHYRTAGEA